MKNIDYKNSELSVRIEMKKLFGRKEEFLYDLLKLFKQYDLDEERLDCLMLLDQRRPYDEDIMYSIGETCRIQNNLIEMEKWYNKVREITTEHDVRLLLRLGETLTFGSDNSKVIKKGIAYLESARQLEPKNIDVLYCLIKACIQLEEQEYEIRAKKYCEQYLKLDPENEEVQEHLAELIEERS